MLGNLGWMLVLAGLVCLLHMIKDFGVKLLQRIVAGKESIKVKLLEENAVNGVLKGQLVGIFAQRWRVI